MLQQNQDKIQTETLTNYENDYFISGQIQQGQQNAPLQMSDQYGNGISRKLKFHLFHTFIAPEYLQMAEQMYPPLKINMLTSSYEGKFILQDELDQKMKDFEVLAYKCRNKVECEQCYQFLTRELREVSELLKSQNIMIKTCPELPNTLSYFVFVLLQECKQYNSFQKQELLNLFIQQNIECNSHFITLKSKYHPHYDLKYLNIEFPNIQFNISDSAYDLNEKQFITQVECLIYGPQQSKENIVYLEQKVNRNILQYKNHRIIYVDKTKLIYENIIDKINTKDCRIKQTPDGIHLFGSEQHITAIESKFYYLKQYLNKEILKIPFKPIMLSYFKKADFPIVQNFLMKVISKLNQNQLYAVPISLHSLGVDISFYYILRSQLEQLYISLQNYADSLQAKNLNEDEFNCLCMSTEQVLQQLGVMLFKNGVVYIAIGTQEQINQINERILPFAKKIVYKYQHQQPLVNRLLHMGIQSKEIKINSVDLSYFDGNKLLIPCDKTKQQLVSKAIEEESKKIQCVEIPVEITYAEAKFLQDFRTQEMEDLSQKYICDIYFQKEKKKQQQKLNNAPIMNFKNKKISATTQKRAEGFMFIQGKSKVQDVDFRYKVVLPLMNAKNYQSIFGSIKNAKIRELGVNFVDVQETIIDLLDLFMGQDNIQELLFFIDKESEKDEVEQLIRSKLNSRLTEQAKPQWQWLDNPNCFVDYDDSYMNQQIEDGYQIFLKDPKANQIDLKFPCNYTPGTHQVDLRKNEILDMYNCKRSKIKQVDGMFYIDDEQADDSLNIYLQEKVSQGKQLFEVFIKTYQIHFKSQSDIYQFNNQTQYKRAVQRVIKEPISNKTLSNWIQKQNDQISTCQIGFCIIRARKQDEVPIIQEQLMKLLQPVEFTVVLPPLNDELFFTLVNAINKYIIEIKGDLGSLTPIKIVTLDVYVDQIKSIINAHQFEYPWAELCNNINNIEANSDLFFKIQKQYDFLKIKSIHQVQNRELFKNYNKLKGAKEMQLLYGNKSIGYQNVIFAIKNGFKSEYGQLIKFGCNWKYAQENQFKIQTGEKYLIICQVSVGRVQPKKHDQCLVDGDDWDSLEAEQVFYVKPNRAYPQYLLEIE